MKQKKQENTQEVKTDDKKDVLILPGIKDINQATAEWIGTLENLASGLKTPDARSGIYETMQPKDPIEAMLISQIASMHELSMITQGSVLKKGTLSESNIKTICRLSDTFMRLVDSLKNYKGKQTSQHIRVEQVTVEPGAQAIVGPVQVNGGRS